MARRPYAQELDATWRRPSGILPFLFDTSHKSVGTRFIVTALGFMVLAGLDSLVIRTQLAVPNAGVVGPETFGQLFTTHGSAMMFLFAVPIVEGLATYFVPLMVGARDMPFPRLNAFGYYLYLFGGLLLYAPTLADIGNLLLPGNPLPRWIPDNGWFAYTPLSGIEYSPDLGQDIWLVALTLAEVSAVCAAIELLVTILKCRAPGMTASRMPLFVWSVLGMAGAILVAFPALIVASALLEVERSLGLPFFDPTRGGDPILWQHLFWVFGHPEVYIMFLPATGVVSTVLPVFTGRPIVGYALIVVAILATAVLSLGLWVHHMFATGLPWLGLTIFSAASMMIAIPSGIQVFAWLATLLRGRRLELTTAMLFVLGFLVTFVLGGLTGVMVASVPFDLQVHDTYFVVAHLHYVLVGGVMFPVFAAIYYWFPKVIGRPLDERLGRLAFLLQFVGFNLAFLPQHALGLLGMPRRVFTYPDDPALAWMNLASSAGAFVMAAGVALVGLDLVLAWRRGKAPDDPWSAHTLEWATSSPPRSYNFATTPIVGAREPRWREGALRWGPEPAPAAVAGGGGLWRELLGTDPIRARPTDLVWISARTPLPMAAAVAFALASLALLPRLYPVAALLGAVGLALLVAWIWPSAEDRAMAQAGRSLAGFDVPRHVTGSAATPWWGLMAGLAATASGLLSLAFATVYLAAQHAATLPAAARALTPVPGAVALGAAVLAAAGAWLALRFARAGRRGAWLAAPLVGTVLMGGAGIAVLAAGIGQVPDPASHAVLAGWVAMASAQVVLLAGGVVAATVAAAQALRGHFDRARHQALDHVRIVWAFVALAAALTLGVLSVPGWGAG